MAARGRSASRRAGRHGWGLTACTLVLLVAAAAPADAHAPSAPAPFAPTPLVPLFTAATPPGAQCAGTIHVHRRRHRHRAVGGRPARIHVHRRRHCHPFPAVPLAPALPVAPVAASGGGGGDGGSGGGGGGGGGKASGSGESKPSAGDGDSGAGGPGGDPDTGGGDRDTGGGDPPPVATVRTEDFERDPDWDGHHNRRRPDPCPIVEQDFGHRPSGTRANDVAGEVGGRISRSYNPAYYAKRLDRTYTLDDRLSASGTLYVRDFVPGGSAGAFFGFFDRDASDWRTPSSMGFRLSDSREHPGAVAIGLEYGTERYRTGQGFLGSSGTTTDPGDGFPFDTERRYEWRLDYDPAANGGDGRATFSVEGASDPVVLNLPDGYRDDGASFDRFGLLNQIIEQGGGMRVYFDDLTVNGAAQPVDSDPGWDGRDNVVKDADCAVQDKHDFGFSDAHGGTLGGLVWRTDETDSELGAHYGDRIDDLGLDQPLEAGGTVQLDRASSDSGVYFGWFNQGSHGGVDGEGEALVAPSDFLGLALEGPSRAGWYVRPAFGSSGNARLREREGPVIFPGPATHDWRISYDPAAGDHGRIIVELDGTSRSMDLTAEARDDGALFDRFGLKSFEKGGHAQTLFFDDLVYTAGPPPSAGLRALDAPAGGEDTSGGDEQPAGDSTDPDEESVFEEPPLTDPLEDLGELPPDEPEPEEPAPEETEPDEPAPQEEPAPKV